MFPIFVAEGSSEQKLTRIRHNGYLARAERSLLSIGGALFVYGMSFGPQDDHVLRAIRHSKVSRVWIGIYGDPGSASNRGLMERVAADLGRRRRGKPPIVNYYEAKSAAAWG